MVDDAKQDENCFAIDPPPPPPEQKVNVNSII